MRDNKEAVVLLEKYRKAAYTLAFYLVNDADQAYELAARAFVSALQLKAAGEQDAFFVRLCREVIGICRSARVIPSNDPIFDQLSEQKRQQLSVVRSALQRLDFDGKVLVLLRDQARLPYRVISDVLRRPEKDVRAATFEARVSLRDRIQEVLANG